MTFGKPNQTWFSRKKAQRCFLNPKNAVSGEDTIVECYPAIQGGWERSDLFKSGWNEIGKDDGAYRRQLLFCLFNLS